MSEPRRFLYRLGRAGWTLEHGEITAKDMADAITKLATHIAFVGRTSFSSPAKLTLTIKEARS